MVCCVTGHRPKGFPFPYDNTSSAYKDYLLALEKKVQDLIARGFDVFLVGMAQGVDMDFAAAVLNEKKHNDAITLEAAIPCPDQTRGWGIKEKLRYRSILRHCTGKKLVSSTYHNGCMQARNMYMVDRADLVIAVWNGERHGGTWNTISYAKKQGKPIEYIYLKDF